MATKPANAMLARTTGTECPDGCSGLRRMTTPGRAEFPNGETPKRQNAKTGLLEMK